MQSQKPSCRKARSSPGGGQRRAARARARCPRQVVEERRLEAEEPAVDPVVEARLLLEASTRSSSSSSAMPNWMRGRTTVTVAAVAVSAVEGDQRLEVDVGDAVRVGEAEASRRRAARATRATRPPVGVSRPVSTHSISTGSGHSVAATNSSIISPR